jgi:hypothetical protein
MFRSKKIIVFAMRYHVVRFIWRRFGVNYYFWVEECLGPEDRSSMLFYHIGKYLPDYGRHIPEQNRTFKVTAVRSLNVTCLSKNASNFQITFVPPYIVCLLRNIARLRHRTFYYRPISSTTQKDILKGLRAFKFKLDIFLCQRHTMAQDTKLQFLWDTKAIGKAGKSLVWETNGTRVIYSSWHQAEIETGYCINNTKFSRCCVQCH